MYDNISSQEPYTKKLPGEAAPRVFGAISTDLDSMQCVLGETADVQLSDPLPPRKQARLKTILEGCNSVLADLQYIVQKYQSLGTDEKSAWDRLRLGGEDIAEIRSRLVFNMACLTAFRRYAFWATYQLISLTASMPVLLLERQHQKDNPYRNESTDLGNGWSSSQGPRGLSLQGVRSCPLFLIRGSLGRYPMPKRS